MGEMNLPEHWKAVRLGEVTEIFKGGTPKRSVEKYFQGDVPWAIPTDITALDSGLYIDDTNTHISEEALGKSAARLLPAGTVLLTSRATIGETAIPTIPMATNQGFANFLCKEMLLNIYLAYYLRNIKQRLKDLASGSTFKEITKGTLLNVKIPLPPLPEQRAIAHVLQTIQEAKAARQREIALERERKAALMDFLFSHGTRDEPRKQTEIGEIPESWEVLELGEIVTLQRGKDLPVQSRQAADIPIVGSNGIVGRHNNPVENIPVPGVATGRSGSIGHLTYIDQPYWPLNTALYVRDFHGNDPMFVYYWLHRFPFEKYSQGVSVPTLNRNLVHPVPFRLPLLSEQKEIAGILQAFDTKIAALEQESARLDELFHAMLDELMTGKRSAVPLIDTELP